MTVDEFIEKGFLEEMNQKLPHALRDGDGVYNVVVKSTGVGGEQVAVFFFMGEDRPKAAIIFNDADCFFTTYLLNTTFHAPTLSAEHKELSEFLTKLYTGL